MRILYVLDFFESLKTTLYIFDIMIKRRSREQVKRDIAKIKEKYRKQNLRMRGKKQMRQEGSSPYRSYKLYRGTHFPPEITPEEREILKRKMIERSIPKPFIRPNKLQMEIEASCLLRFYIMDLFANYNELSFPEIVGKANRKFRGLLNEKDVAKLLFDYKKFREDSFFKCSTTNFKDRLTHFLKHALKRKINSFMNSLADHKKYDRFIDYLYVKETYKQRIKEIELESLMDPKLSYRVNENSSLWSVYQLEKDKGIHPAKLISFFPDKSTVDIYT